MMNQSESKPSGEKWLEIDLAALEQNSQSVRALLSEGVKLCAVVKANAYGLGAVAVAKSLSASADMLAVTSVEEAIELRQSGIDALPILVFLPPTAENAALYGRFGLTATIDSPLTLDILAGAAGGDAPIPCHLKINLGMNRFGLKPGDPGLIPLAERLSQSPNLKYEGIYAHLPEAADNESATRKQIARFCALLEGLAAAGLRPPLAHIANSATTVRYSEGHLDMVRVGTLLYGQSPAPLPSGLSLADPFRARCRIAAIQMVQKGERIGYGGDKRARRAMRLAVIPFGYHDGFGVNPAGQANLGGIFKRFFMELARAILGRPLHYASFEGRKFPLAGRVAMQTAMVDISAVPSLEVGDEIDVYLRRTFARGSLPRIYRNAAAGLNLPGAEKRAPGEG